jgi:hypothetical protein
VRTDQYDPTIDMEDGEMETLMKNHGYVLGYKCVISKETVFVRRSTFDPNIFERLKLHVGKVPGTRKLTAFWANAEASIVPGYSAVKGVCENQFIAGLPFSGARGTSILDDNVKKRLWEAALADRLPVEISILLKKRGRMLLDETSELRRACVLYYEALDDRTLMHLISEVKMRFGTRGALVIEKLPGFPVVTIPNQVRSYQMALALICLNGAAVEGDNEIGFGNPYEDRELFLRLQVLASRIANEVGWNLSINKA